MNRLVMIMSVSILLAACNGGGRGDGNGDAGMDASPGEDAGTDAGGGADAGDAGADSGTPGYTRIPLQLPDDFPDVDGFGLFDVAIAADRAWVSAYTSIVVQPGWTDNGPVAIFERQGNGAFAVASAPDSRMVFFPYLCAVDDNEVYVTLVDTKTDETGFGRIFAREIGPEPVFAEEPAPEAPQGRNIMSMRSACFSGGNLWLYGSTQIGDDIYSNVPFVFHRAATGEPWETIALPDAVTAPSYGTGVTSAWIQPNGSGFYAFSSGESVSIFFRTPEGAWSNAFEATTQEVAQILDLTGDSGYFEGVAGTQSGLDAGMGGFLRFGRPGFSLEPVPDTSELWAAACDSSGRLYVGGCKYDESDAGLSSVTVLFRTDYTDQTEILPRRDGRIQRFTFPKKGQGPGLAILDFTLDPAESGLYEVAVP